MAAILADSPEGLLLTGADVPPASGDVTLAGWFYVPDLTPANYQTFFYLGDDPATYAEGVWVGLQITTGNLLMFLNSTVTPVLGSTLPAIGWYYIVYTRTGTTHRVYVDLVEECTAVQDQSLQTHTHLLAGTDTLAPDWSTSKAAYLRAWTKALTETPQFFEQTSPTPVDTVDLWLDTPLYDDLLDDSGNGRDWAESGGTITFDTPVNNSITTAIDLVTLPASVTGSLVAFYSWYKYTSASPEQVLGMLASIVSSVNPRPFVTVYVGPEGAPSVYLGANSIANGRLQIPVANGTTYYFKIEANEQGLMESFDFDVYVAPNYPTVAKGVPVINSDEDSYPTAFVDPATGIPLGFRLNTVAGETADITSTGISLFYDAHQEPRYNIYDRDMNLLYTNTGFVGAIGAGHFADHFYAITSEAGQTWVRRITLTGMPSTRWGPFTAGAQMLAVNRAETIAYYLDPSADTVRRWDLVGDTDLGVFISALSGYKIDSSGVSPGALLVLGDESLIVGYWLNNQNESRLRKFTPAGTLLWDVQYGVGAATDNLDRVTHDPDDDTNFFWTWIKEFGLGKFQRIDASNGTVDVETPYGAEVQDGGQFKLRYDEIANTFGHPFSCPFVIAHGDVGPPVCPGILGAARTDGLPYSPPSLE
jgi:hypothetical protein